jgi:hypothetical protein
VRPARPAERTTARNHELAGPSALPHRQAAEGRRDGPVGGGPPNVPSGQKIRCSDHTHRYKFRRADTIMTAALRNLAGSNTILSINRVCIKLCSV